MLCELVGFNGTALKNPGTLPYFMLKRLFSAVK